jgi:hypothetical protein
LKPIARHPCRFLLCDFKSNRIFRVSPVEFLDERETSKARTGTGMQRTTEVAGKRRRMKTAIGDPSFFCW